MGLGILTQTILHFSHLASELLKAYMDVTDVAGDICLVSVPNVIIQSVIGFLLHMTGWAGGIIGAGNESNNGTT